MDSKWCPIEKRECGNVKQVDSDGIHCAAFPPSRYGDGWYLSPKCERCPVPNSIKDVPPDPGEGYALVPYDPEKEVQKEWHWWDRFEQVWSKSGCDGSRMIVATGGGNIHYRRPIAPKCPACSAPCKHIQRNMAGEIICMHAMRVLSNANPRNFGRCPWPFERGV